MAKYYYRKDNPDDVREMEEFYIALVADNNPKANDWLELPPKPGENYIWMGGIWVYIEPSEVV